MKNIEYLTEFFKKHNLSGKIKVEYTHPDKDDDYMGDITLEDGNIISINDVIFDIISNLDPDVGEQWLEIHKESGISFDEWMRTNTHYIPKNIDRSSIDEYHKDMEEILEQVKENINKVFELEPEDNEKEKVS